MNTIQLTHHRPRRATRSLTCALAVVASVGALGLGAAAPSHAAPAPASTGAHQGAPAVEALRTTKSAAPSRAKMARDINRLITRLAPRSPLKGSGARIVAAGAARDVDPRLIVSVAAAETGLGMHGNPKARNAYGLTRASGPIRYRTWDAGTKAFALTIRNYHRGGLTDLAAISSRYAPYNDTWVANVSKVYVSLGGDPAGPTTFPR